jgi:NADPH:quinone reductase-like Zn-dependent oxidoreductase
MAGTCSWNLDFEQAASVGLAALTALVAVDAA